MPYIIDPSRVDVQIVNDNEDNLLVVKVLLSNDRYVSIVENYINDLCSSL